MKSLFDALHEDVLGKEKRQPSWSIDGEATVSQQFNKPLNVGDQQSATVSQQPSDYQNLLNENASLRMEIERLRFQQSATVSQQLNKPLNVGDQQSATVSQQSKRGRAYVAKVSAERRREIARLGVEARRQKRSIGFGRVDTQNDY